MLAITFWLLPSISVSLSHTHMHTPIRYFSTAIELITMLNHSADDCPVCQLALPPIPSYSFSPLTDNPWGVLLFLGISTKRYAKADILPI